MLDTPTTRSYPDAPGDDHRWGHTIRVRGTTYLWGSAGITTGMNFPAPLLLHISNDKYGEQITLGTETPGGTQSTIGTLKAGEHFSIPIQGISGVFASCRLESSVACRIRRGA